MNFRFKIFSIFFSLFFAACTSSYLPDKEANLSDFILKSEIVQEQNISSKKETFDFVAENFPDECQWETMVRVVDGDTIIVGDDIRVRFIGIDTPETKHPNKPIQKFGPESTAKLEELLSGETRVCLIEDDIGDAYDKYGRKLAYIFTEDGMDIDVEMLLSGLARGYYYFPFEREEEFRHYEAIAKSKKLNLWE